MPVLYIALLCLTGIDMAFGLTGNGEASLGAWVYIFSFYPAILVAKLAGIDMYFPPENPIVFIVLQALGLLLVGAIIDAIRRRKRGTDV